MTTSAWIDTDRERSEAVRKAWRSHTLLMLRAKLTRRRGLSERHAMATSKDDVLRRLVALPVSTWTYAWEHESVKHMGPMSQDFASSFGLGSHDDRIDNVDECGVIIAAMQALHKKVTRLEARIAELEGGDTTPGA